MPAIRTPAEKVTRETVSSRDHLQPGRGKRLLKNLIWLPVSILLFVVVLEGLFYLGHAGEEEFVKYDPDLGFFHFKDKLITFRSEGFSQDLTNSEGFRDVEHSLQKQPGVTRVAVLGDSKTEAFQVPMEQTFVKLLEKRLNASGKGKYEVLNCGVSNYGTGQEYVLFLRKVMAYKPDICILCYHALDSGENILPLGDPNPAPRPYFALDPRGQLMVHWGVLQKWYTGGRARFYGALGPIREDSRIWGVLSKTELLVTTDKHFKKVGRVLGKIWNPVGKFIAGLLPRQPLPAGPSLSELDPTFDDPEDTPVKSYGDPIAVTAQSPQARQVQAMFANHQAQWPVTAAILHHLNKAAKGAGCKLVVATLPVPNNSFFYFKEMKWIEQQARDEGFGYIDVHRVFPSLGPMAKSPLFYHKYHFTPQGHELVADTLYKGLKDSDKTP